MYLFVSGPPGIGKTTVGALLAELLGAVSLDIDAVIARREHQSAEGLIKKLGLERFRDLETEVLSRLESTPAWMVVAVGGGTALRAENRARMREKDTARRHAILRDLQATAHDRDKLKAYLMRSSMIEGLRQAEAIA